ncbi:MAG: hypothetical protein V3U80_00580 [Flavobacteriaceae bacterium]
MKQFNQIGLKIAIASFVIGTFFLISYAITHIEGIAVFGYFYLLAAIFINLIIALVLFVFSVTNTENRTKNLKTIGVMLFNIPIAYLYVIIVFDYLHL